MINQNVSYEYQYRGMPTVWGVYNDYSEECQKDWEADSTLDKYDGILLQRLLPNLKNHNRRSIDTYTREELDQVIKTIRKQGQNGPDSKFVPFDEKTIWRYEFVLRRIFTVAANHYLCENLYSENKHNPKRKSSNRNIVHKRKTLTLEQELAVVPYIATDPTQDGEKMALYLMYIFGNRNAEACGYNFGNIIQMTTHPDCYKIRMIETTSIGSNQLDPGGKTSNAPRYSPIINSAVSFLSERRKYIEAQLASQGISDINIDELPIACVGQDYQKRCSARNVTDAARKMFEDLGFKQDILCAINKLRMEENAQIAETTDTSSDLIENDLTAYILRRTYATHLAILGMEQSWIEYLVGHMIQNPYDSRNALSNEDVLFEMKQELEKRSIVGNNCLNNQAIQLHPPQCLFNTKSHTQTLLIPAETARIHLQITAKEPGDELSVTTSIAGSETAVQKECGIYSILPGTYPKSVDVDRIYQKPYNHNPG